MKHFHNPGFLTRRIDRCYLIAACAKVPEKRKMHLELARYYRQLLRGLSEQRPAGQTV